MQVAATVSGLLVVAAAVIVARLLRHGDTEPETNAGTVPQLALAAQQPCG
jgi:hypothetical protein